jgi:hypothetical protein
MPTVCFVDSGSVGKRRHLRFYEVTEKQLRLLKGSGDPSAALDNGFRDGSRARFIRDEDVDFLFDDKYWESYERERICNELGGHFGRP